MASQIEQIATGSTALQASGKQMASLLADVRSVVEQNSAVTEQMSATASSSGEQIAAIAAVAEENSAATEELSASAEEMTAQVQEDTETTQQLDQMADALRDQVAAFKLNREVERVVGMTSRRDAAQPPRRAPQQAERRARGAPPGTSETHRREALMQHIDHTLSVRTSRRLFGKRAARVLLGGSAALGIVTCGGAVPKEEFTQLQSDVNKLEGDVTKLSGGEAAAGAKDAHGATTTGAKATAKASAAAKDAHGASAPHFAYEGKDGPADWAKLAPENAVCGSGATQSPIDIAYTQPGAGGRTVIKWQPPAALEVANNGHTIQTNIADGGSIEIDGVTYKLALFHFRARSEHTLNSRQFAMETHFVHKSEKGDLAVIGVLHGAGTENQALSPIWAALPKKADEKKVVRGFDLLSVLPRERQMFRYAGSLTTPPCTEGVRWQVIQTPTSVSPAQVGAFLELFKAGNARPVQPLKARDVLKEGA
ncbi:MAG: hypothetical protein FJ035_08155 [Chloroflexi bacterium]|nr:hypothetical protein [Chloroflexota bacterium]